MAEFRLGAINILEICDFLSKKLVECGVSGHTNVVIPVPSDKFGKVDEDLYYRTSSGNNYVPSDGEIHVKASNNVTVIIKDEGNDVKRNN